MERYERVRVLGRGAFGVATLVQERETTPGRQATLRVVKEIDLGALTVSARREAHTEIQVLAQFSHPNIVEYMSAFLEEMTLHIVMEFADGGDLAGAIRQRREEGDGGGARFAESDALSVLSQSLQALAHIHAKRILHRDIKGQNIFLTSSGTVKLGDFGIAKVLGHTSANAKTMIGTPHYLAPEVCENKPYGSKADIWSIGVVFYEILALQQPFQAYNIAALVLKIITGSVEPPPEDYSKESHSLVSMMLQKAPQERPEASDLLNFPSLRRAVGSKFEPAMSGRGKSAHGSRRKTAEGPSATSQLGSRTDSRPSSRTETRRVPSARAQGTTGPQEATILPGSRDVSMTRRGASAAEEPTSSATILPGSRPASGTRGGRGGFSGSGGSATILPVSRPTSGTRGGHGGGCGSGGSATILPASRPVSGTRGGRGDGGGGGGGGGGSGGGGVSFWNVDNADDTGTGYAEVITFESAEATGPFHTCTAQHEDSIDEFLRSGTSNSSTGGSLEVTRVKTAPPVDAMMEECRRNRELRLQIKARVEGEPRCRTSYGGIGCLPGLGGGGGGSTGSTARLPTGSSVTSTSRSPRPREEDSSWGASGCSTASRRTSPLLAAGGLSAVPACSGGSSGSRPASGRSTSSTAAVGDRAGSKRLNSGYGGGYASGGRRSGSAAGVSGVAKSSRPSSPGLLARFSMGVADGTDPRRPTPARQPQQQQQQSPTSSSVTSRQSPAAARQTRQQTQTSCRRQPHADAVDSALLSSADGGTGTSPTTTRLQPEEYSPGALTKGRRSRRNSPRTPSGNNPESSGTGVGASVRQTSNRATCSHHFGADAMAATDAAIGPAEDCAVLDESAPLKAALKVPAGEDMAAFAARVPWAARFANADLEKPLWGGGEADKRESRQEDLAELFHEIARLTDPASENVVEDGGELALTGELAASSHFLEAGQTSPQNLPFDEDLTDTWSGAVACAGTAGTAAFRTGTLASEDVLAAALC